MQEPGILQPLALAVAQAVNALGEVEHGQRQGGDLARVLGLPTAALGQLDHRAAADVGVAVDAGDVLAVAVDVVEQHALAQGEIAQRDLLGAEPAQEGVEQDRARHHQVRAPRILAGQVHALCEVHVHGGFAQPPQALRRHAQVADLGRCDALVDRGRDRSEGEDGTRRANDAVVAGRHDRLEITVGLLADERHHLAFVAAGNGVGVHVAFRQPDHAHLEAARELDLAAGTARDLHAAATDVDDHGGLLGVDAVDGGQVDQARFFSARDQARADAGLALNRLEKGAAVLGFARGAGGDGENLVDVMRGGQPLELRQRLQRRVHRFRRHLLAVETAGAEPDHFFLAIHDLERKVRAYANHDHMNGVGTNVDGS